MKIGNLILSGRVILAPLAGIADSPFRLLARRFGAALVHTEMISAEGLSRGGAGSLRLLDFKPEERPIGVQIFGSDPERMASACKLAGETGPDLIDINCGCPVRKVVRKNGGAALLKDLKLLEKILLAVRRSSQVPVTLKIRSGCDQGSLVAVEVAKLAQECGFGAIAVHPRTREDGFSRKADWNIIAEVKGTVDIPVVGSGDVFSPEDAKNMLDRTSCDAVMIGRGSFGNPWIFSRSNTLLDQGQLLAEPSLEKRIDVCLQHVELSAQTYGESTGVKKMRKHMVWYTKGMARCKELRLKLSTLDTLDQVRQAFSDYLAQFERKQGTI
ncbi:MAG: tRNA dihydrouridine synthase DusB [Candidatus Zixiibacteriota bacterium]|nr:MAG: tRNA dihydrouridine synthase DusB [candidate division Zixibacteria bacterium]